MIVAPKKQNALALQFAGAQIKSNRDFVLEVVKKRGIEGRVMRAKGDGTRGVVGGVERGGAVEIDHFSPT